MNITQFWNKYRFEMLVIISVIILIVLYLLGSDSSKYQGLDGKAIPINKKWKWEGKYENKCKEIIENIFKRSFNKVRPSFLKYKNGRNLELDGFCESLGIAFEMNGIQHRKFSPFFHKSQNDFTEQQQRDIFKKNKCNELGIKLIIIPDTIPFSLLNVHINSEIKRLNIIQ